VIEPRQLPTGCTLRLIRETDAEAVADAYTRNRTYLQPWDPLRPEAFFTSAWHAEEIPRQLKEFAAGEVLPLVLEEESEVIGRLTVSGVTRGAFQSGRLGYWIDENAAGRGTMTAAVRSIRDIARDDFGLHRLEAGTLLHNRASQRVLENAGFERIGIAPLYLCIAGVWQDHVLFQAILRAGERCAPRDNG
jgi:[ribosomal protein S5]-alanine N-acetyltransferase